MAKVSIIIAIYGVEKYLNQCIESVLKQSFSDLEIILVDDGSPDKCPEICDEFAKKDNRVVVIHQENQGSVCARINGAKSATGEYLSFIDGDDWIEDDAYESMYLMAVANNADIVITGYKEDNGDSINEKRNGIETGIYRKEELEKIRSNILYSGEFFSFGLYPAFWNKLIKRELYWNGYIEADSSIKMGEDAVITYPIISKAECIVVDNELKSYHYRYVQGSMSRDYDYDYFKRVARLIDNLLVNLDEDEIMKAEVKYYALYLIKIGMMNLFSRNSKLSLLKRKEEFEFMVREYKRLGLQNDIDWSGFDKTNRNEMKSFVQGQFVKFVIAIMFEKLINVFLF